MKTLTIFSGEANSYGDFLNTAPTPFSYAGRRYLSVEHYLLVQKAFCLNHGNLAQRLLEASTGEEARHHASMLYGERERLWNMILPRVAIRGIRAKFQQHGKLYKSLRSTAGRMLVYARKDDPFWGTGCEMKSDTLWGQCDGNLLGRLLMKVRVELKEWEARGMLRYEDVTDHPEFLKSRVMRYEFDQLLDHFYAREVVWPYVMVMAFPEECEVHRALQGQSTGPFIPLTTSNLPSRGHATYANTSPKSLWAMQHKPEAGLREMTQELYDLFRLGLLT